MNSPTQLATPPGTATSGRHRAKRFSRRTARWNPPVRPKIGAALEVSSIVLFWAVGVETGCAREATHQTKEGLCGCDEHIQELARDGRAAIRRQRTGKL